jgi:hypothetical protein
LVLAIALALAGGAVEYDGFATDSPLKFVVGVIAMGFGFVWLYRTITEWHFGSTGQSR